VPFLLSQRCRQMSDHITVNLENYKALHKLYHEAQASGKSSSDIVKYKGQDLVLSYLYYVLEYMELVSADIREYKDRNKLKRRRLQCLSKTRTV